MNKEHNTLAKVQNECYLPLSLLAQEHVLLGFEETWNIYQR
jgi:hypothetical protein